MLLFIYYTKLVEYVPVHAFWLYGTLPAKKFGHVYLKYFKLI